MNTDFSVNQKRALAVVTVIAVAYGAYFLSDYFVLIVVAAVSSYLFTPLFTWLRTRVGAGIAAAVTLISALLAVIVPIGLVVTMGAVQISRSVEGAAGWIRKTDTGALGNRAIEMVNRLLARVPWAHATVDANTLRNAGGSVAQTVGKFLLQFVQQAVGSIPSAVASSIVFLYLFIALLTHRNDIRVLVGRLNPLGEEVTDLYLARMGSMVRGTVSGQFVIAVCQGVAAAGSVYVGGFHRGFFVFLVLLTALSIIPLGAGIVTIPFGIGMMLYGHPMGGAFIVVWHLLVVTNIDNFLRPVLVPREARLNPALMLLSVFSGIAMFGPWGIVIGPVVMIMIVTTIDVYLAVYQGVEITAIANSDSATAPIDATPQATLTTTTLSPGAPAAPPR